MIHRFFNKMIYLLLTLGFLTSCFNNPLIEISPNLQSGFVSKNDFKMPATIKIQKILNAFIKITINESSDLSMAFREGTKSIYRFNIRFLTSDYKIEIKKVHFTSSDIKIQNQAQFVFDNETGEGTFSWTPHEDYIKDSHYIKSKINFIIVLKTEGTSEFAIERPAPIHVEQVFKSPKLFAVFFDQKRIYINPEEAAKEAAKEAAAKSNTEKNQTTSPDTNPSAYINPSVSTNAKLNYVRLSRRLREQKNLLFYISDINNISPPHLQMSSFSDEKLFNIFGQHYTEARPLVGQNLWSIQYNLRNGFSKAIYTEALDDKNKKPSLYKDFEEFKLEFYIRASGYKSKLRTIYFRTLPSIQPEYEVLESNVQTSQDTQNGNTVILKEVVRVRYTIPATFMLSYKKHFDIHLHNYNLNFKGEHKLDSNKTENNADSIALDLKRFFEDTFEFKATINNEYLFTPETKRKKYALDLKKRLPCNRPKFDALQIGIKADILTCDCDNDFMISRNESGEYFLDKQCAFEMNFSVQSQAHKIKSFNTPHIIHNVLALSNKNVFNKFIDFEQYKEQLRSKAKDTVQQAQKNLETKRNQPLEKNLEYLLEEAEENYTKAVWEFELYENYTNDEFFELLKNEIPMNLHYKTEGQKVRKISFFYDIGVSKINCYPSEKDGFALTCKVAYSMDESSLDLIKTEKNIDIGIEVVSHADYVCENMTALKHQIIKVCHFKSDSFSLTSFLEIKKPNVFILQSDASKEVVTDNETRFSIQKGNVSIQTTSEVYE